LKIALPFLVDISLGISRTCAVRLCIQSPDFRMVMHFGPIAIGGVASLGEESLMGSEVNLILRLEKLPSSLGEPCCLRETANTKLGGLVETRHLGEFELKGFEGKCVFFAL
jgi:hypothetical protein